MAAVCYALCTVTALLCAVLLLRAYRGNRIRLLLWGGICFLGLTVNNGLLVADKILLPELDLYTTRLFVTLASVLVMLYGLIWEEQ